ncbi:MAG TPA: hemerythrin domain-containing protein [Chitinophagaceae bacterium]|nr:hemerythrin domain-containing protein [Chitinophagaceae bacterium]
MIQYRTPLKRSRELSAFSREHHEGLLFVWKIRQGIRNLVSPRRIAAYCQWFCKKHLEKHMQQEEAMLTSILSNEHPMMQKMFDEHEAIRVKIASLEDYLSNKHLARLADVVEYHIRFEERELFQLIEQIATSDQLRSIEEQLRTGNEYEEQWQDNFWSYRSTTLL